MEIEVSVGYDDNGESILKTLPAKFVVCGECDGHGTVLNASMRNHAYSREEFDELFDDEQQDEYFKRGGRYGVQCPNCKGKNVVKVVDDDACVTDEQKATLKAHNEWYDELCYEQESDRRTMMMESGIFE